MEKYLQVMSDDYKRKHYAEGYLLLSERKRRRFLSGFIFSSESCFSEALTAFTGQWDE
ncbi:hypothetical protein IMSAGC003_01585 [Lachnospiraceae bacterium]|nr:hypothetical protein [Acetatifactor sp.]GFH95051.1 hypothetical protein IMSAGC003_01585 [Lachnospiraceae bacterium]